MSNRAATDASRSDRAFTAVFTLVVAAMVCACLLVALPRPVPYELPVLFLDVGKVQAQLQRDGALAADALASPRGRKAYELLLRAGRVELDDERGDGLSGAIASLRARMSGAQLAQARALAAQRFMQALRGELRDEGERRGLLGRQGDLLIEHGYVTAEGSLLAPELALRATYKVRWNMLWGHDSLAGLSTIEQLAYQGFRGLEAHQLSPELRSEALRAYLQLGGRGAREAWLLWAAMNDDPRALIATLQESPEQRAHMRLRNMGISAVRQLEEQQLFE